jgi:hypothetical protein
VVTLINTWFPAIPSPILASAAPQCRAVAEVARDVPSELYPATGNQYGDVLTAISVIEGQIAHWYSGYMGSRMPFIGGVDPITIIRSALERCPDELPSPLTTGLAFIPDDDLRESIRRDISGANQAVHSGEWKAATVLAGAAIEALLLWSVQQPSAKGRLGKLRMKLPADTEHWSLAQFIDVAEGIDLISKDTAKAASLAKDFRNLIHPGRAVRLGQSCDRGTALLAVAALEHVARDLERVTGRTA